MTKDCSSQTLRNARGESQPGNTRIWWITICLILIAANGLTLQVSAQDPQRISNAERRVAQTMLADVADDVQKHYYDPKMHGLDWPSVVAQTKRDIAAAPDMMTVNALIQALLEQLKDSHTFFVPVWRGKPVDYGWSFQAIGNRCFVTHVEPKSDAAKKGMQPGDEVFLINGFTADRSSALKLRYAMVSLTPTAVVHVYLRDPAGKVRKLDVGSSFEAPTTPLSDETLTWHDEVQSEKQWMSYDAQSKDFGPDLMVIRLPGFERTEGAIDDLFKKAQGHKALIIDLRGNQGGLIKSVTEYLSHVLPDGTKVAQVISRDKPQALIVKASHRGFYDGKLLVLVDSRTASAGEIFARAVQLQGRAQVIGDLSSGDTMEAIHQLFREGGDIGYTAMDSVTIGDLIMSDGHSLEGKGVVPDELMLPTAQDLAAGRDPVLARAIAWASVTVTPEAAGKLFPHVDEP